MPASAVNPPTKSFLFLAVLRHSEQMPIQRSEDLIIETWGKFSTVLKLDYFPMKEYYAKEMGQPLAREIYVYEDLYDREILIQAKLKSMQIEQDFSFEGRRTINIDPGLISLEQLTLISTKPFSHRIFLGNNLYGDLTYIYKQNNYQCLPWTYPDYKEQSVIEFFESIRKKLKKSLFG
jgi:hypothetical protein